MYGLIHKVFKMWGFGTPLNIPRPDENRRLMWVTKMGKDTNLYKPIQGLNPIYRYNIYYQLRERCKEVKI